jgi:hypothetical protein
MAALESLLFRHDPADARRPLAVTVRLSGGVVLDLRCAVGDLESFGRFRARVASTFGTWLTWHEGEPAGRRKREWAWLVDRGFCRE